MRNLFVRTILFLLLISANAFAQNGQFTFTVPTSANTSAGIFKLDGTLVKTLWNNEWSKGGAYTRTWDGTDDMGQPITSPQANYQIKIVTNNVQYDWQGTIGNSSDSMTGASKHRGYKDCMTGLAFGPTYGYFCTAYSEGSPSVGKFGIGKPNTKLNFFDQGTTTARTDFVATDGINVYWGGLDSWAPNNTFVYATKVSDDSQTSFSSGIAYAVTYGQAYTSLISKVNAYNSSITGLAVQKTGSYIFVARSGLNQVQVLNKTTGALVQTLAITKPRGISIDGNNNLWMALGTNTVAKYTINTNGTLSSAILSLQGLLDPLATQVSPDGMQIGIIDGNTSQQVKFYDNSTGVAIATLGTVGGYENDATVNNNKFYFTDVNDSNSVLYLNRVSFICYQPDGSFWVNDPGNYRVQHYSTARSFMERIMSMGATYSVYVDKKNINRLFAGYLEFAIDYSVQTLTGSTGWSLVKNWGAKASNITYNKYGPAHFMTLNNGRTYAFLGKGAVCEIIELTSSSQIRFTGKYTPDLNDVLCSDGSLQSYVVARGSGTFKRFPLIGFDAAGNPLWSSTAEILAQGVIDNSSPTAVGNPVVAPKTQIFSTTDKAVLYNYKGYSNNVGPVFATGYHLGLMQRGGSTNYLFQTEKSTDKNYIGPYPNAGWFDEGNGVNDFAGGTVNIIDRNIITSYHGEFWKNSQTNKYNHYYDNGLAIAQFGTTRPESGIRSAAMMCGNALTPIVVKDANGDLYLYHGDESDHAAVHRWKITGLNTIQEQAISITYPSSYAIPKLNYNDLLAGLPFDSTLMNNRLGWTRYPATDNIVNKFSDTWMVETGMLNYEKDSSPDLYIEFTKPVTQSYNVSRDLGSNNVTNSWKVSGTITFAESGGILNGQNCNAYLEILDANGKVLTTFYAVDDLSAYPIVSTKLMGNTVPLFAVQNGTKIVRKPNDFEVSFINGVAYFFYAGYPMVSTTISDPAGNWKTPKTLRIRFASSNSSLNYAVRYNLSNLRFFKDYTATIPANQPPVADAGADIETGLPGIIATLNGNGTDPDGAINSYKWVKLSGPLLSGLVSSPNTASTTITTLIQGVYLYQLTVTDNNGALAKDTVQLTFNPLPLNMSPVATAGIDAVVPLSSNTTLLTGSGTDSDGMISRYNWVKISGPSSGAIATASASSTIVNNLSQGVYQFELTITDNKGAVGKDTVVVAINQAPYATAGSDKVITIPVTTVTLTGSATDDGTITSYFWKKIAGPSSSAIMSANSASTILNSLVLGVYQYELTVTDNWGVIGKDTVLVSVNQAPFAKAGLDKIITLPINTTTLVGSGNDSDGTVNAYAWKKISGPSSGTLATSNTASTVVNNLTQGRYDFELTVTDNWGATGKDTLQLIVNIAPSANAGADTTITLPNKTETLNSIGSSDADGTIVKYAWRKVYGPAYGTIQNAAAAITTVNNMVAGIFGYELSVTDDNGATIKDTVEVTINQPPVAKAGNDKVITLPTNSLTLVGSGTDLDGTIAQFSWIRISGPSLGTIGTSGAASTTINSLGAGIYQYQLTVTDNWGATGRDTLQVIVNQPPVATAGNYTTISLPVNSTTLNGKGADSDGTVSSYSWRRVLGPGYGTIQTPNAAVTVVNGLVQGIYKFELTVTDDNNGIGKDTVQITVNKPPNANAGVDRTIILPTNSINLAGTGSDVDGTVNSYSWKKISGPSSGTMTSAGTPSIQVNGLVQGVYLFELTVADNWSATGRDTMQLTVNVAPVANAGNDVTITLPANSTTLAGAGTDADGTITGYLWKRISGPSTFVIQNATSTTTGVNSMVQGVYKFELAVTDNNSTTVRDTVQITVNKGPNANAGTDKVVTTPTTSTTLTGTGTDSDGTISSYSWTKISGPSSGSIQTPNTASTVISNLPPGVYQFELTVTDNWGAIGKDQVQVIADIAPDVTAGVDQLITLPISSVTLTGSATDADGSIASYSWRKISGPAYGTIQTPAASTTNLTGLVAGIFAYELTAKDNDGGTAKDTIQITVNNAPVASAGSDRYITLPTSSTTLSGTGVDADGSISKYSWARISGPSAGTINTPTAASTTLSNLAQGVYVYELTVTDNRDATGKDQVQVTVNALLARAAASNPVSKKAPIANAGPDETATSVTGLVTLKGMGTDTDGYIKNYAWVKLSGPSGDFIKTPGAATTELSNLAPGMYQYQLTVTDNDGETSADSVWVTVKSTSSDSRLKLYPNPVKDVLNLVITTNGENQRASIAVYNWLGMLVNSKQINTPQINTICKLDVFGLSSGIYSIILSFDHGQKISDKFIKN
ncbi:MAG: C-terminal target protein [Ferruginibacter sp.]|nr:C-terminal target protein [Ferruginibacter sp.]